MGSDRYGDGVLGHLLKPDTLNGQKIFRTVTMDGQQNHVNQAIIFPPSIHAPHGPVKTLDELVEEAVSKLVVVGDKSGKITEGLHRAIRKLLIFFMKRAVLNERERIRLALEKHGMKEAQHAMMDGCT